MPFVDLQGSIHHYLLEGTVDKPVLIFSNSLGTDLRIWDGVTARLNAHFRILRYDKRGHGLSDAPRSPFAIDDLARDLFGLLDLLEIPTAVVCGISVGGLIAQRLAVAHPDRVGALVLCDTGARIGSAASWQERIELVKSGGLEALVQLSMERWFTQRFRTTRGSDVRGYANMLRRTTVEGYIGTCYALGDADLRQEVMRVEVPALVLCGDQDSATPPEMGEELSRLVPRARFSLVKQAAHLSCIEQPAEVVTQIMRFSREVEIV